MENGSRDCAQFMGKCTLSTEYLTYIVVNKQRHFCNFLRGGSQRLIDQGQESGSPIVATGPYCIWSCSKRLSRAASKLGKMGVVSSIGIHGLLLDCSSIAKVAQE